MAFNLEIKFLNDSSPPPTESHCERGNLFVDRRKNSQFLVNILAGYKPFLYEDIFGRLKNFLPPFCEVCIISSGLFDEKLFNIAKENNWSYLSTAQNNVPLAQNMALMLYNKAELIFKMDEDIFITQGCFERLIQTYEHAQVKGHYKVGFVAPLIPINGYGHVRILEKLGLDEFYEQNFEKILYGAQPDRMIEKNPEVAKFFWGEGNIIPSIDVMNLAFQIRKMEYRACPIRFSIGLILFHKMLWKAMGGWNMPSTGTGIGADEVQICNFCVAQSFGMIISENTVAGHLSFGQQNAAMKEYYLTHREKFRCP